MTSNNSAVPFALSDELAGPLLAAFLANAPDAVYFKDRRSRFLAASQTMAVKFGLPNVSGLLGKTDFDFFAEEHARPAFEDEQAIIATGQPVRNKLEKETTADGKVTWCVSTKLPLRDESGTVIGTFGISRDVTASRRLQEQLETAHRELLDASRRAGMADVATGVIHNIGNVLNSVNVAADVLAEALRQSRIEGLSKLAALIVHHASDPVAFWTSPRGQQVPAYLAKLADHFVTERERMLAELVGLRQSIDHIKGVVAMQQTFASSPGLVEALDPVELMEDALRLNVAALMRHDVRIMRDYVPAPRVLADRTRVLQILINLIRNAKHALDDGAPAEKVITFRVQPGPVPGFVQLAVADNGIGIPAENLDRIFGHGFTTRRTGHGFGLHSAANAARELGGAITVTSRGVGCGAVFTLQLPVVSAEFAPLRFAGVRPADDAETLLVRAAGI